jgi:glycosyltransferase involved in cell wall biosynthesis
MGDTGRGTCLFMARVADPKLLETIEFYREDISALRALGFDVRTATRNRDAMRHPRPALAYCWWHSTALPTVIVMRLRRVPVVTVGAFHFQDGNEGGMRWWVRKWVSRLTARLSTMNLAISAIEGHDLEFLPPARRSVIPLSIDTEFFVPGMSDQHRPNGITIGQLNPGSIVRKGMDLAIRAVPLVRLKLPEYELHVVGPASESGLVVIEQILASIDRDGVVIHGEVTREEKRSLLQSDSVYLQMSVFEGFGLAALEALGCGVPVVHSGEGSLPEVVADGGVEVKRGSVEDLATAIVRILADPSTQNSLSIAARRHAETFSRDRRIDSLKDVIERAIGAAIDSHARQPRS